MYLFKNLFKKQKKEETADNVRKESSKADFLEDLTGRLTEKLLPLLTESVKNVVTALEHPPVEEYPTQEITMVAEPENDPVKPADESNLRIIELSNSLKTQLDRIEKRLQELAEKNVHVPAVTPPHGSGSAGIAEIETKLVSIGDSMDNLLNKIDDNVQKDKLIDRLHGELQSYKVGLRREILMPLLKEIIRCHDSITDQYKWYENELEKPETDFTKLFPQLLKEYKKLSQWLNDLLYPYDIEIVVPKVDEEFNPMLHKRYKNIPTDDAKKDKKIESCFSAGFHDVEKNRSLKLPEVNVYKLNNN
jgi:molecular chaperone GrpE